MVQIDLRSLEKHVDPIPTGLHVLIMERLVQVPSEVHHEPRRLGPRLERKRWVNRLRGIVRERRDHAPGFAAVALEVDAAPVRRVVLGVDVVVCLAERALVGFAEGVGPCGYAAEVVGGRVAEDFLEVGLRGF